MRSLLVAFLAAFVAFAAATPAYAYPPPERGIWAETHHLTDAQLDQLRAWGYRFVFSHPNADDIDRAYAHGLRSIVWLGGYKDGNDSEPNCTWRTDDTTVKSQVAAVKDRPGTAYWFVDDEPHANVGVCPDTPQQIRDRNALIKSVDVDHPTVITENRPADYAALANTTDVLGLVGYPCNTLDRTACSSSIIPGRVQAAEDAGVKHYWGMPQTFEEFKTGVNTTVSGCQGYYRYPSKDEYETLIAQWRDSREEAEFAFMGNRVFPCAKGLLENTALPNAVTLLNGH